MEDMWLRKLAWVKQQTLMNRNGTSSGCLEALHGGHDVAYL